MNKSSPARKGCPLCGKPSQADSPFCSKACAYIDLGVWLSGDYRIPGDPLESEEDLAIDPLSETSSEDF
jgi:endogenous inhibitor of DNA gyrase (YacG/DUF329 family)